MKKPERILIVRTDRIGDVVLSTPVIRQMRKLLPDAYISFMVRTGNKDLVANNPDLNEVIELDRGGKEKGLWGIFKFSRALKKKKFDLAIALHPTNRVHMLLFFAGIPVRIGYDRKMGYLLCQKIPHKKHQGRTHEVDYNLDLLRQAGFDISGADRSPYIATANDEKALIESFFKKYGIKNSPIAVHVGASCRSKRWDTASFAAVCDSLALEYKTDIVLLGGDETTRLSRSVVELAKADVIDLTGALRLGEVAEFLSRCRVFISNDSGPVHIATAVGTPCVVIFGRNDPGLSPERWGPVGEQNKILHKDVGCKVCLAHNCEKEFACLKAISPIEVTSAVRDLIGAPA